MITGQPVSKILSLFALFSAFVVYASLNLAFGKEQGLEAERARHFLAQFPAIRVAVIEAEGNGHQAVGAILIKRLREIGYQGAIELRYQHGAKSKLEYLLPPFQASGPDRQYVPQLNLHVAPFEEKIERILPFGIVAADYDFDPSDHSLVAPSDIGVERLLVIQPSRWGDYPTLKMAHWEGQLVGVRHEFPMRQTFELPKDVDGFLDAEMSHSEKLRAKIFGLSTLLHAVSSGKLELLSAYGLGYGGPPRLVNLVYALDEAQRSYPAAFKGPIVVGLISNLNHDEWSEFWARLREHPDSRSPSLQVFDVRQADLSEKILALPNGSLAIVKIGSVSQGVWNLLNLESTMPPLVAGTTGINFLLQMGRPFVMTRPGFARTSRVDMHAQSSAADVVENALYVTTFDLNEGNIAELARFYLVAKEPVSELRRSFERFADFLEKRPDRTCAALLASEGLMDRWDHLPSPGVRGKFMERAKGFLSWLLKDLSVMNR